MAKPTGRTREGGNARADEFVIRVPATTANLGPGFDCLGMALDLCNDFAFRVGGGSPGGLTGQGTCAGLETGEDNMVHRAMERVREVAAARGRGAVRALPPVRISVTGRVPVSRGLGSSATAIVAGVVAAGRLLGARVKPEDLLLAATIEEGHPDNVAPALLGSLATSVWPGGRVISRVSTPHPSWRLALLIPGYELSTKKARAAIPAKIPHRDAVFNLTRVPAVVDALERGDARDLRDVMEDRLHEPYRRGLIRGYDEIRAAATEAGAAAVYLSGAGPTMAAFCKGQARARRAAQAMAEAVRNMDFPAEAITLRPRPTGAEFIA